MSGESILELRGRLYKRYPDGASIEARVAAKRNDPSRMSTVELEEILHAIKVDVELLQEENNVLLSQLNQETSRQQVRQVGDNLAFSDKEQTFATPDSNQAGPLLFAEANQETQLDLEIKLRIANSEVESVRREKEEEHKALDHDQDALKAGTEEADLRLQESRSDLYDLRRDIVPVKKLDTERIQRYLVERLAIKDSQLAKVQHKSQALKAQVLKCEHQLQQQHDVGALQAVDFDQLKIENRQFLERIDQKNKELVTLKVTASRTVQIMNALTEKLTKHVAEQAWLRKEIRQRHELLRKLEDDLQQVGREHEAAQKKYSSIRLQHGVVKVPKVEDYIQQKAETYVLTKAVANWRRKVEIANGQKLTLLRQESGTYKFVAAAQHHVNKFT